MKYSIAFAKSFKKSFKKLAQNEKEQTLAILSKLANEEILEDKYHDHALAGKFKGCRDCHIKPDLILIYRIDNEILELLAMRLGSHSDLS